MCIICVVCLLGRVFRELIWLMTMVGGKGRKMPQDNNIPLVLTDISVLVFEVSMKIKCQYQHGEKGSIHISKAIKAVTFR